MADPESARLGLCGYKALRDQSCDPAANDVFVAPAVGHTWDEPAENVHVVVEDGEAADGDGKVLGEKFEPGLDPGPAVCHALAAEEGSPDSAGNAVAVEVTAEFTNCRLGNIIEGGSFRT